MAELSEVLALAAQGKAPALILLEGDEFLTRQAAKELAEAIVPEKDRAFNLLVLDAAAGAREITSHLVTVAMFAAPKAIVVEGAEAFAEEVDGEKELSRARDLWQGKRQRDGARRLLKLVRSAGWGAPDVAFGLKGAASTTKWRKELGTAPDDGDKAWLQELSAYAIAHKLAAPPDDVDSLVKALERGLPPRTHLILVAESLPARHPLARAVAEKGVALKRKAERKGRSIDTLDISVVVAEALRDHKKRLAKDAELELKHRLGDDLRLIAVELEKLALSVGDRPQITKADVESQIAKVAEEEFFALGEAVGDGDLARALSLFHEELRRKTNVASVALPFLGGIASAVRKLLYEHARLSAIPAASGPRELQYDEFQRSVFPAIESECAGKKQKVPNPYGAYLNYKRARRRSRDHWRQALVQCSEADQGLKSGADARLLMERLLVRVCAPPRR